MKTNNKTQTNNTTTMWDTKQQTIKNKTTMKNLKEWMISFITAVLIMVPVLGMFISMQNANEVLGAISFVGFIVGTPLILWGVDKVTDYLNK